MQGGSSGLETQITPKKHNKEAPMNNNKAQRGIDEH
jgi:hypothetical protein